MLTLTGGETVAGVAGAGASVTYTITGAEVSVGVPTYKVLAQGQLGNAAATFYTCPASPITSLIKTIHLANTTGIPVPGVALFVNGTADANRISGSFTIPANGWATVDQDGWRVYNANGELLTSGGTGPAGQAGAAGQAVFLVGDAGEDGDMGPPGVQGFTGQQGPVGPAVFLVGDTEDGDQGPPGPRGLTGDTGAVGPAVFLSADQGEDGDVGPPGIQGLTGPQGIQGPAGPQGIPGLDGDDGLDGDIGPPGATGPQGSPAQPGAAAYGEMTTSASAVTTMTAASTFYQIVSGWVAGDNNGFTFNTDELIADVAGVYLTICTLSQSCSANNQHLEFQLFRNGVAVPTHIAQHESGATEVASVTLSGVLQGVVPGDTFDVRVQNTTSSGKTITVYYGNLTLTAVAGATGPQGSPGADGDDGDIGPVGPRGLTGDTGAIGPAVFLIADEGEEGQMGPPGPAAAAASATVAIKAAVLNLGANAKVEHNITVVDATVASTSLILVMWGATLDTDDNGPDTDSVTFRALAGTGSFVVRLGALNPISKLLKINYLVG